MNKTIKRKWISALKSGKYGQTREKLKSKNGTFCCLGVLCDIYAKEKNKKWHTNEDDEKMMEMDDSDGSLPKSVMKWAGLNSGNPKINGHTLSEWNDQEEYKFKEIATLIEKGL